MNEVNKHQLDPKIQEIYNAVYVLYRFSSKLSAEMDKAGKLDEFNRGHFNGFREALEAALSAIEEIGKGGGLTEEPPEPRCADCCLICSHSVASASVLRCPVHSTPVEDHWTCDYFTWRGE